MSENASKAMRVVDKWDPQFPQIHHLVINKDVALTRDLNVQLAIIANGKRHACKVIDPTNGSTTIKVIITHDDDPRRDINKLRDVIIQIASTIGYKGSRILIELEGRMDPIWMTYDATSITDLFNDLTAAQETESERTQRLARERTLRNNEARQRRRQRQGVNA